MTKRPPNCSTWRYATLLRNGPTSRCWIGPRRLTASAFSTRAACRPTNRVGVDRRRVETKMGYGNRGKTNYVFPPFPQPRLPIEKLHSAVYTKYLTPPCARPVDAGPKPRDQNSTAATQTRSYRSSDQRRLSL